MPKVDDELIAYDRSFLTLVENLSASELPIEVGSFSNFVQNIYSLSFPEYNFDTWHVRLMCDKIDEILNDKTKTEKYLLAVLPRYHLKSTILGYATTIYRMLTSFGRGMYISYKDELAEYHTSNIKDIILNNPVLSRFMKDLHPQSASSLGFKIGEKRVKFKTSGIFSVKRGIHTDCICICDDILGDLSNPMVFSELEKVSRLFHAEVSNIPNKNCLFIVFGTTIDYTDLLFELKKNDQWDYIWMPAINPNPEHDVLWETQYDREWLERRKSSQGWKAFSTEFLLTPVIATEAFFTKEEIDAVTNKDLHNHSIYKVYNKSKHEVVVAGFDVGKRRNPSHLSVFVAGEDDRMIMIHQSFWDNMEYSEQVEKLQQAIESFQIDKVFIDSTRGEMEDRTLPTRNCELVVFTAKTKVSYATEFAKKVEKGEIELLSDDRFTSQIVCVTNDLKAPETPMGHGDSFWTVAMAITAFQEYYAKHKYCGTTYLANLSDTLAERQPDKLHLNVDQCKVCGKVGLEDMEDGSKRCPFCFASFGGSI